MESSLLVWSLRIRETEALLKSRQQERDAQAVRRETLSAALRAREADQACTHQRELQGSERLARAHHGTLRRRAELQRLQRLADDGGQLLGLHMTRRSLASRRQRLAAASEAEARRCAAFGARVSERRRTKLKEPVLQLEAALSKVDQRLSYARKTYDMASLALTLDEQRARRETLQMEADVKKAEYDTLSKQVEDIQERLAQRERSNVEAVERSQAALREIRSALVALLERQAAVRKRLADARNGRLAAASRLADLQRATDAARRTLACLDAAPAMVAPPPLPQQPPQQ